ncbi:MULTISPECIES: hypothetical protein [Bacillaceae]|nr:MULTISPECIES: hypothetical protein [Bacillaceae]
MGSRRKTPPRIPIEEFSVEIGDVNGVKLFEARKRLKSKGKKEK